MKSSIALIGFMGTGKTAVGRVLAQRLGKAFAEMDALIERQAGKTIPEIFEQDGELRFRELEIEVTKQLAAHRNTVVACGGGVVLNRINIDRLKREYIIVLLTASARTISERISRDGDTRPLLQKPSQERIKALLDFRRPFYERAADIKINTSRRSIESIVNLIIDKLNDESTFRQK